LTGTIVQINRSFGGVPKYPVAEGTLTPLGLESDHQAHPQIHGGPRQAILVIASETIEELKARGYPVFAGALGVNLTTRGLDRRLIRIGMRLRAGEALLEVTKMRAPCSTLDVYGAALKQEIYDKQVKAGDPQSPRWGMSGFYCSVLEPGRVRLNDIIAVAAALA
jgi:MOSC domain-containing protein YiiM